MKLKHFKEAMLAAAVCVSLLAATATTSSAADSSAMDKLIAAAQKEGKLVFYSTEPDNLNNSLGAAFQAKYGIPVEFLRLVSGPLTQRFASEQQSGVANADLLQVVGQDIWTDKPEWFVDLQANPVEGWATYPEMAKHKTCADMRYSLGVITYNKDLVDAAHVPTSYKDMLAPYWKGKILLTDPRGTPAYMGWAAAVQDKYGTEFLKQLAAQNPTLVDSATPGAQQVAAGAYYVNFGAHMSNSTALRQKGAPLGVVVMGDVPTGLPTCMGIAANAPHPNAARLFMTWSLTPESHQAGCEKFEAGSPLREATNCVKLPDGWKPTNLDVMKDEARQQEIVKALGIE